MAPESSDAPATAPDAASDGRDRLHVGTPSRRDPLHLHEFFEAAARRWPEAVAVDVPPGSQRPDRVLVTYAALDRTAEAIAGRLQQLIHGECVVAILLPRESELLYAAQLAVLKAGAAYCCVEPAHPDERIESLLGDCDCVAVLTDADGCDRLRERFSGPLLDTRALADHSVVPIDGRPAPGSLTPSSLAYVIYTSGTTGTPKGTLIEHRSIANLVASDLDEFRLGPGDRVAQNSASVYDSSVEEIWLAFAAGATLVVMDHDAVHLGPDLVEWLRRERITVFCAPPTLLRTMACSDPRRELPGMRLVYVGGEALPRDVAEIWAPGRRLENGYGPTECAVTALRATVRPGEEVPIGLPIRGISAWVLNESLEPVGDGELGELCLGGIGLARGYHRRPELTAEKFPVHPALGRIYRTGDVARAKDGVFYFHGRIDSQVKVRGHRIELEEIDAHLARCDGVREAACRVHSNGASQALIAFVVPHAGAAELDEEAIRSQLAKALPEHMVPVRIGRLPALPRTAGGKLDRARLPAGCDGPVESRPHVPPRNAVEEKIAAAFASVVGQQRPVSVTDDFFLELGGDSLSAALAITLLREDPATATLTIRDLYDRRTVAELASCVAESAATRVETGERDAGSTTESARVPRPVAATLFQSAWLLKDFLIASFVAYAAGFLLAPAVVNSLGPLVSLILLPPLTIAGFLIYGALAVANAVWLKRRLIGRYEPVRVPVWGRHYLKHWVVQRAADRIPWWLLRGTEYELMVLRALGARIGRRVHIHRGVALNEGGWDLLEIGDDVTLCQGAAVRLIQLESREMIVGPVVLGNGCTLDVQSGVHPHTRIEPNGFLCAHSSLPRGGRIPAGERWDGIPAKPAGSAPPAPDAPTTRALSPVAAGNLLLLARTALVMFVALPAELLAGAFWMLYAESASTSSGEMSSGLLELPAVLAASALAVLAIPLTLAMEALACRAMGRVREGATSRWSPSWIRLWLKPSLVDSAQAWLYGTLMWPWWLRLAGAKIGRGCEISGLIDAIPEMIEIGPRTFCADGIYLGGPRVHRGTVTTAPVKLGSRVFLGNGALIPAGGQVAEGTLLGINTVADERMLRPDTAWFGHPAFQLPRRQVTAADARFTHRPSAVRYASRITWEGLRFALAVVPTVALLLYVALLDRAEATSSPTQLLLAIPLVTAGVALLPVIIAIAIKWLLLGRVRPGIHPLWSCWNSRWDFFCAAWHLLAGGFTGALRGTALLAVMLRAIGVRVGRGVVLGGRFAEDVPDPDMLTIEDGATVEGGFQAHTFEDRVLKNGPVRVRAGATVAHGAVLLYGADIGADARVAAHSVVMKHEHLPPGKTYEGFPVSAKKEPAS